jgi:hypothetical protein
MHTYSNVYADTCTSAHTTKAGRSRKEITGGGMFVCAYGTRKSVCFRDRDRDSPPPVCVRDNQPPES